MSKIRKENAFISLGQTPRILKQKLTSQALDAIAGEALEEDLGPGDPTAVIFPPDKNYTAYFLAREAGVLSGTGIAKAIFQKLHKKAQVRWQVNDGERFQDGVSLGEVTAPMAVLLAGERTALNFLQQLSGIATLTARYVEAVDGSGIGIYDTRKTTPLLRALEKQAVVHGGGRSHRFGLYDMAMLKNNHIDAAGSIAAAVQTLRRSGFGRKGSKVALCIEVRDLTEALEALNVGADLIMLDNMQPAMIRRIVAKLRDAAAAKGLAMPPLEVSGGINLKTIGRYRDLPVDRISVGALTHSPPAIDISFRFKK